jgi:hypothetical protein
MRSQDTIVGIVTRLQAGLSRVQIQSGESNFSHLQYVQTSSQPPIQWVAGFQPGHEVDHSPPSSTEVKNEWSYTSFHMP